MNRIKAKFDIALFHDALDSPLAQIAGQGEDGCGRVAQLSVLLLHPVEFRGQLKVCYFLYATLDKS